MPLNAGLFELKTVYDLFCKLEDDLSTLLTHPTDSRICFNFFVTAEHMPEWLYKGEGKKAAELRADHAILRVCSHIANGAKHFQATNKKHVSVVRTRKGSVLRAIPDLVAKGVAIPVRYDQQFVIDIDLPEASEFGSTISVEELAQRIVDFWRNRLQTS